MAELEADCREPQKAQLRKLKEILSRNADSAFAKEHGLNADSSLEEFRKAVPVSDYEAHRPYIERIWNGEEKVLSSEKPFMFATTSGTMCKSKYIPVTESYIKEFRHASIASGFFTLQN
ncbi:MAG: GH3 auxin-responsive promoter family protein, partial [Candidatus Obscuribacterales bacterium]|nr:GH3 auxin-responsive promoter family protein [Candidatus Obscuribacterales bacterium]